MSSFSYIGKTYSFGEYAIAIAPTWLLGENGSNWLLAFGELKNAASEWATQVTEMKSLYLCEDDALFLHGSDRYLERGVYETDSEYRSWLKKAWEHWTDGGTRQSVISQLSHFLSIDKTKIHLLELTRPFSPSDGFWTADGDITRWSRFWVYIEGPQPYSWAPIPAWDVYPPANFYGVWDEGACWDTAMPYGYGLQISREICKWKSGHSVNAITVLFDTASAYLWGYSSSGTPPTWGGGATWGGAPATIITNQAYPCEACGPFDC